VFLSIQIGATIMFEPVKKELISPQEYKDTALHNSNIERAQFIPPKIGDGTFGCFEVVYKTPVLRRKPTTSFGNLVANYVNP
jgi:hypothetical protein